MNRRHFLGTSAGAAALAAARCGQSNASPEPRLESAGPSAEALDAAARDYQLGLAHLDTRRNLLTRGVALNHLVGVEFSIGPVRARGVELAEPCGHMEKLCGRKGARESLIHRGGLRVEILSDGVIRIGDAVRV